MAINKSGRGRKPAAKKELETANEDGSKDVGLDQKNGDTGSVEGAENLEQGSANSENKTDPTTVESLEDGSGNPSVQDDETEEKVDDSKDDSLDEADEGEQEAVTPVLRYIGNYNSLTNLVTGEVYTAAGLRPRLGIRGWEQAQIKANLLEVVED